MIVLDWRDLPSERLAPVYAAAQERWQRLLSWDMAASHEIIEAGRTVGHVPGYVAVGAGERLLGWTYFVLQDGTLQIGGLAGERPAVIRTLVDAVLGSPEAHLARQLSCFVFPDGGGTASALARQRFDLNESLYLACPLGEQSAGVEARHDVRRWRDWDLPALVRLLTAAYDDTPGASCFAADGTREQWAQYTVQLIGTPACGAFRPAWSFVVTQDPAVEIYGAVITTQVGPDAAHIAQIAIAPGHRGRGLAEHMVGRAMAAAAASGMSTITLMVDARNARAQSLYARLGFQERARFLHGRRAARTRAVA